MSAFTPLTQCLACGGDRLKSYVDFGDQPLANAFHKSKQEQDRFPLGLNVCLDCYHSQQHVAVDPDRIYLDYPYVSGTSRSLQEYFRSFVLHVENSMGDGHPLHVLDIASNDGSLLREFKAREHVVFGVDPAHKLAPDDIATVPEYWNERGSKALRGAGAGAFDVIVAMNVLGHVDNPLEFLCLCKKWLAPGGRIYIQTSQAHMLRNAEFDTAYHEHISFFTCRSMLALAAGAELVLDKISHVPVHGTSYLFELVDRTTQAELDSFSIALDEKLHGYYAEAVYGAFWSHAEILIDNVQSTLALARKEGYRVAGYGAAAKGMTFMNVSGIELEFVVDDSPLKIGKMCPGSQTPVVMLGDKRVNEDERPLFWVILAWNMADEIKAKIKARRPLHDDRYMVYYPKLSVMLN